MAASPDGRFMATGGADGLVCLWMVYENQVAPNTWFGITASVRFKLVCVVYGGMDMYWPCGAVAFLYYWGS